MIYIVGDIHGYFSHFNQLLNRLNWPEPNSRDIILQVGDFGFWPKLHNGIYLGSKGHKRIWDQYGINNQGIKIYWCEGNHEDLPTLFESGDNEHMGNIFWQKRGSVITLPDGRNVMFIGGAKSIDRRYRIEGISWFPQEIISNKDIEGLPDIKIDIMITHTAPLEFSIITSDNHEIDPSRYMLSEVLKKYKPNLWFFGHFHRYVEGSHKNTKWFCLADICSMEKWYMKI